MTGRTSPTRFVVLAWLIGCLAPASASPPPPTLYWEGDHLQAIRSGAQRSAEIEEALAVLSAASRMALERGPYSVVFKPIVPPSGDKHDYLSYSRYWWPNPETADGLPFIRRDGEVNRKRVAMGDRVAIGMLCEDVETLALAAYLQADERAADHAVELLRVWFLEPTTRMNPNLNFAQGVPGIADGRAPGVLDARHFIRVLDGVALLREIDAIDPQVVADLRSWFSDYLDWLVNSELGKAEGRAENNHGLWYVAQVARIALFVGQRELAEEVLLDLRNRRIPEGILPDGRQPNELKRTLSLHYSLFSLSAIAVTARLGESLGIDLWDAKTDDGAGFRVAFQYAAPHVVEPAGWPHPMIKDYTVSDRQAALFYLASSRLDEPQALEWLRRSERRRDDRRISPVLFREAASGE